MKKIIMIVLDALLKLLIVMKDIEPQHLELMGRFLYALAAVFLTIAIILYILFNS